MGVAEGICRRDLSTTAKPRRFWSTRSFVLFSPCAGFEPFSLPADNCNTGVPLDWAIHKRGIGLTHGLEVA
jgi:hypothetical protein